MPFITNPHRMGLRNPEPLETPTMDDITESRKTPESFFCDWCRARPGEICTNKGSGRKITSERPQFHLRRVKKYEQWMADITGWHPDGHGG